MKELTSIEVLGNRIIGCAIEAHKSLGGCGLLESLYEDALCYELNAAGLTCERQVSIPVKYKGTVLSTPLKIDILVDNQIIVECKATIQYNPIFESQLLTYLRLSKMKLGYVFNFGESVLKNGIHRVVNDLR